VLEREEERVEVSGVKLNEFKNVQKKIGTAFGLLLKIPIYF
jgi:hypothetical protein